MVSEPTLYDVLGCPKNASQAEIKTAYHRKARELHPDRSGSPDPALFQQLQAAYECLSDAQSRAQYDRTGQAPGQRPEQRSGRQSGWDDGGYGGYADFEHHFHYGPSPFTSTSSYRRAQASSQTVDLPVELKDFFVGRAFKFDIKKKVVCRDCKGSTMKLGASLSECIPCRGIGQIRSTAPMGQSVYISQWSTCGKCHGSGRSARASDQCIKCKGEGRTEKTKRIQFEIGRGNTPAEPIIMEGEGDEEVDADAPGDLCFKLQPKAGLFTCDGSAYDLQASASLTLSESLLGFHRVLLVGLDGTPIRMKRDARHEDVVVVRGQGLYKRDKRSRGDLAVRLKVEDTVQDWVQGLDADQRAVLEGLMPPKRVDLFEGKTDVIEA